MFAGARFIFPARPNSGYFRSLHFLRLFRMIRFSELAGKILHEISHFLLTVELRGSAVETVGTDYPK